MSAILSADDLNDFISPGVACIKPVETLPLQQPTDPLNPYEVTTEDRVAASAPPPPAQISLTDCLACSGCVTSAEAVLISLQSHEEVLTTLNNHPSFLPEQLENGDPNGRVFVASVSPQTRASLAAVYNVTETEAGNMISHLLSGPQGLRSGGAYNSGFTYIIDTNALRTLCRAASVEEVARSLANTEAPKKPILASACPGWICYAEKTHPHVLPHLSQLKSPQALAGTLVKSVLARRFGIHPSKVWHVALMPCFDKKLEASREELTDTYWQDIASDSNAMDNTTAQKKPRGGVRDVDCVITARELLMLAESRGISFPNLPRTPLEHITPFPDDTLDDFLFKNNTARRANAIEGPSGGYAFAILAAHRRLHPNSEIIVERGRNVDVLEYSLRSQSDEVLLRAARYYGFRNIQNLVRRLKPARKSRLPGGRAAVVKADAGGGVGQEYAYVEVMACPGGCTNGGGQVKVDDVVALRGEHGERKKAGPAEQKEWLARVDEAYYSAEGESEGEGDEGTKMEFDDGGDANTSANDEDAYVWRIMQHWSTVTGVELGVLLYTSYRQVESDVGKLKQGSDMDRVAGLASSIGGGW